jgi:hypothetical protein
MTTVGLPVPYSVSSLQRIKPVDSSDENENEDEDMLTIPLRDYVMLRSYLWDAKSRLLNVFLKIFIDSIVELVKDSAIQVQVYGEGAKIDSDLLLTIKLQAGLADEILNVERIINKDEHRELSKIEKRMKSGSFNMKRRNKQKRDYDTAHAKYLRMFFFLFDDNSEFVLIEDSFIDPEEGVDDTEEEPEVTSTSELNLKKVLTRWMSPVSQAIEENKGDVLGFLAKLKTVEEELKQQLDIEQSELEGRISELENL